MTTASSVRRRLTRAVEPRLPPIATTSLEVASPAAASGDIAAAVATPILRAAPLPGGPDQDVAAAPFPSAAACPPASASVSTRNRGGAEKPRRPGDQHLHRVTLPGQPALR